MSEDECGTAAMGTDVILQQLLVQLMNQRCALLLRGRAAVLLAGFKSGDAADIFAQVNPRFFRSSHSMLSLESEHESHLRGCTERMSS